MFRGLVIVTLRGRGAPGDAWHGLSAVGNGDNGFCQIPLGSNYSLGYNITLKLGLVNELPRKRDETFYVVKLIPVFCHLISTFK